MSFIFRSSIRIMQCSRRMLNNLAKNENIENFQPSRIRKANSLRYIVESDLTINEKLKNKQNIEDSQWILTRENLIKNFRLSETNVDSQIFDICSYYDRLDEAANYFKFLERNNYQLNLNIIGNYFRTFYNKNTPLTPHEEEDICKIYDDLRKKYPLLDGMTASSCIYALSLTKRWKESLELLDMIKIASRPGVWVMRSIICAAFKNKEPLLGWKMMQESITNGPLDHSIYMDYAEYYQKNLKGDQLKNEIEKMFNFWREHYVLPPKFVIKKYVEICDTLGYDANFTSVSRKRNEGICLNCWHRLNQTSISKEDFYKLSKSILQNIIVGENVYHSTSPQELKRYLLFVQTMKPYDVVIDGLNVAYGARKVGEKGSLENILQVIQYFGKNASKRILVIGRAHMNWWSKEIMAEIKRKADVFLIKNMSQDDPFLLHITLLSGSETYFVSRDLMRQHKFKLDENLQKLFKQWQLSRQFLFHKVQATQSIRLLPPSPFETFSQQDLNGWHIPYVTINHLRVEDSYSTPKNWVCLRKKNKD